MSADPRGIFVMAFIGSTHEVRAVTHSQALASLTLAFGPEEAHRKIQLLSSGQIESANLKGATIEFWGPIFRPEPVASPS